MQQANMPNWLNETVNLARHIPDARVQIGVSIYDLICNSNGGNS